MPDIGKRLEELADEKYRTFIAALTPGKDNILGVRIPLLRKLAKEILNNDWKEYLMKTGSSMEELILQGFIIGGCKVSQEERLRMAADFVPKIDCWPVCDSFCGCLKPADKHKKLVWDFILPYLHSGREFEVRFGVVMLLHYLSEEYAPLAFSHIDMIRHEGYYARMAIAWVLSMYYINCPELTLKYLKESNLDTFTYNKTIQKIIESKRVDRTDKDMLRCLKR